MTPGGGGYAYLHFTDEDTEAEEGLVVLPKITELECLRVNEHPREAAFYQAPEGQDLSFKFHPGRRCNPPSSQPYWLNLQKPSFIFGVTHSIKKKGW